MLYLEKYGFCIKGVRFHLVSSTHRLISCSFSCSTEVEARCTRRKSARGTGLRKYKIVDYSNSLADTKSNYDPSPYIIGLEVISELVTIATDTTIYKHII